MAAAAQSTIDGNLVINIFNAVSADTRAIENATRNFSTTGKWASWQGTQAATASFVLLSIPGMHLAGLAAEVPFLMRKITSCAWGVGFIKGCTVDPKEDLAIILGIMGGEVGEEALSAAVVGGAAVGALASPKFAGMVFAATMSEFAKGPLADAAVQIGQNVVTAAMTKFAPKFAALVSTKLASKAAGGILPFVGPAISAGITIWFIHKTHVAAARYYSAKKKYEAG